MSALLITVLVWLLYRKRDTFMLGLVLYEARPDKGYSLTDYISVTHMKSKGIQDALTYDEHFTQEGFHALFRD